MHQIIQKYGNIQKYRNINAQKELKIQRFLHATDNNALKCVLYDKLRRTIRI